jgi:hypothetical protein
MIHVLIVSYKVLHVTWSHFLLYNTKSEENAFTGKDVIRYEKKQTDVAIIWGLTI